MTLVRTRNLLGQAVNAHIGVAAFNVITLEHAEAIAAGAQAAAAPAILQVSQNAVRFHGGAVRPLTAALREIAREASVDLALHLDHVDAWPMRTLPVQSSAGSVKINVGTF
jgi:fructose-bisphosphate aldolase, class II